MAYEFEVEQYWFPILVGDEVLRLDVSVDNPPESRGIEDQPPVFLYCILGSSGRAAHSNSGATDIAFSLRSFGQDHHSPLVNG